MPKESCILHRQRENLIIIRESFVELFGGDYCAAALLAHFEYLTNGEISRLEQAEESGDPWVSVSIAALQRGLIDHYKTSSIQRAINRMIDAGVLQERQERIGFVKSYLLQIDYINELLAARTTIATANGSSVRSTDGGSDPSVHSNDGHRYAVPDPPVRSTDVGGCYKEVSSLVEEQVVIPPIVPLPFREEQTNPNPTDPDALAQYLSTARRQTKAGRIKGKEFTDLVERLPGLLDRASPEEIIDAFAAFLQDPFWEEKKYPARGFISQFERYHRNTPPSRQEPASAAAPPSPIPPAPPTVPAGYTSYVPPTPPGYTGYTGLVTAVTSIPFAAQEWNRVVTAGPEVSEWTSRDRYLNEAVNHPDFIAALPKILPLCQQAFEAQGEEVDWLNFRWLVRKNRTTGVENWYRITTGEMNWLRRKRGTPEKPHKESQTEMAQRALAEVRQRIAAKKARENQQ